MRSPDGLAYPYREADHIYGDRAVPAQGIVFHIAEGCNVAGYLAGGNVGRGVSAHFVIEADGEVVQMVPLGRVSGSLNPRDVRTSNDPSGAYGRRFTRYYDPDILTGRANHRTISVEMAGRASSAWSCGPDSYPPGINEQQHDAGVALVATLRKRFARPIGVNGHRDFADYKACPGRGPWVVRLFKEVGHGQEAQDPPEPEPEDPELVRMRLLYEAAKGGLEEAEDVIADLARPAARVSNRLGAYVPAPNE